MLKLIKSCRIHSYASFNVNIFNLDSASSHKIQCFQKPSSIELKHVDQLHFDFLLSDSHFFLTRKKKSSIKRQMVYGVYFFEMQGAYQPFLLLFIFHPPSNFFSFL